jgi:hypothetical protein
MCKEGKGGDELKERLLSSLGCGDGNRRVEKLFSLLGAVGHN